MSEHILSSDEAAAIALEKYGPGWVAQDGPNLDYKWAWHALEPWVEYGTWNIWGSQLIGPGHPNPEWRSTAQRIERKRDA